MDYKTILVQVDSDRFGDERLAYACQMAADSDAHLVGLLLAGPVLGTSSYSDYAASFKAWLSARDATAAAVSELQRRFEQTTGLWGLSSVEWRVDQQEPLRAAALHARYADLLILGQPDLDDANNRFETNFPAAVALASGRPVVVTPHGHGLCHRPQSIVVAWNGSREATQAATLALPLLRRAQRVLVLTITSETDPHPEDEAFIRHLSRHGVNVGSVRESAAEIDVGDLMLSHAAGWNADLLVCGAYGHSRINEWIFGGVTRHLLSSMTLPVLLAH